MSYLVKSLQAAGRFTLAQRLAAAQEESRAAAHTTLLNVGKMVARRDRAAAVAGMIEAAAHYRNAGDATLAAHWQRRAASLRDN